MSSFSHLARTSAVSAVIYYSRIWFGVSAVAAVATGFFSAHGLAVYAAALGIAVVAIVSVLASLRFYSPWFSWAAWLVPASLFAVVIEPVRIGVISILTVVFAYSIAAAVTFGLFLVARERLRKWVSNGAF